ncbi:MAG: Gfo/Idh/MocA family oxidoreductase [Bacteroidota bacterium]
MNQKRRAFLKKTGLGTAGIGLLPYLALSKPAKKKLGVCLVGLGNYSRGQLAPALELTEHCQLTGIVTGSPEKIPVWQEKYGIADGNVYNYDNMHRIADNPEIDVIYIVLPTGLHAKYAIKAAETGKHVWCEKPMAKTVSECEAIMAACKKNKVRLSIGYRMQHETNTQKLMTWATTKPFGSLQTVTADIGFNIENPRNTWRMNAELGGGLIYDVGVYCLNAMRYTTGLEPISVIARHENTRPEVFKEVQETTIFSFEFPDGIKANGKTTARESINLLKVDCQSGWYQLRPFQTYSGVKGNTSDGTLLNPMMRNQQAQQMDNDALAIMENRPMPVPGEDGMRDIAMVTAINKSAEIGSSITL